MALDDWVICHVDDFATRLRMISRTRVAEHDRVHFRLISSDFMEVPLWSRMDQIDPNLAFQLHWLEGLRCELRSLAGIHGSLDLWVFLSHCVGHRYTSLLMQHDSHMMDVLAALCEYAEGLWGTSLRNIRAAGHALCPGRRRRRQTSV